MDTEVITTEFELATISQSDAIVHFEKRIDMQASGLKIVYERTPTYFDYAYCQADEVTVHLMKYQGKITGLGCCAMRKGYIAKKMQDIAYWTDLRIDTGSRSAKEWKHYFYSQVAAPSSPDYHTMTVLAGNTRAIKALEKLNRYDVNLQLVTSFNIVQVLTPIGFAKRETLSTNYKLINGNQIDEEKLVRFLEHQAKQKLFGLPYLQGGWSLVKKRWPNFSAKSFIIYEDRQKRIVACVLPFDPTPVKKVLFASMPIRLKFLSKIAGFFGRFHGVRPVKEGISFSPLYMTHMNFSKDLDWGECQHLFKQMVQVTFSDHIAKNSGFFTGLSFMDNEEGSLTSSLSGYLTQSTPAHYYCLKNRELPDLELPKNQNPILALGFEMAFS